MRDEFPRAGVSIAKTMEFVALNGINFETNNIWRGAMSHEDIVTMLELVVTNLNCVSIFRKLKLAGRA